MNKQKVLEYIETELRSDGEVWEDRLEGYIIDTIKDKGGEGQGDTLEKVFKVTSKEYNTTMYVQAFGSYSSWEGSDWSYVTPKEVEPYTKEVTFYREVK